MHEAYARALWKSTRGKSAAEQEQILTSLLALLKKKGHGALVAKIRSSFVRIAETEQSDDSILVTLADKKHLEKYKSDIDRDGDKYFKTAARGYAVSVDPTVIGGYALRSKDTQVDNTYKHHLLSLFNTLTRKNS